MQWSGTRTFAAVLLAVALAAGCGGERRLDVSVVRGKVLYQGEGVPKATVIFHPQGAAADRLGKMRPFAYTDSAGNFQVKTYVEGDGAPPGDYRVSLVAPSAPPPSGGGTKDQRPDQPADSGPSVVVPAAIAEKYLDPEVSGIEVVIREGENDLRPFELK